MTVNMTSSNSFPKHHVDVNTEIDPTLSTGEGARNLELSKTTALNSKND